MGKDRETGTPTDGASDGLYGFKELSSRAYCLHYDSSNWIGN